MYNKLPKLFPWVIIILGLFLRTFHYLQNRSLYTDEAYLANNLLYRSFYELTLPLDASQHAPVLFLFTIKLLMIFLGTSEYVLRLFPFVASVTALLAFYHLLTRYKSIAYTGLTVGLVIFSFAFPLVYYSSELKQYSVEVLSTIICYLLYNRYHQSYSAKNLLAYSIAGAGLVWFSYSSIFVLASLGIVSTVYQLTRKSWLRLFAYIAVYLSWAISFLINYLIIILPNSLKDDYIVNTWKMAYMPVSIRSITDIKWFINSLTAIFDFPLGLNWSFLNGVIHPRLTFSFIGFFFVLAGVYGWFKANRQQFLIIFLPVVLTLLASALQKYPFTERFLLFLAPNFILLLAAGVSATEKYFTQYKYRPRWFFVAVLALLLPLCITAVNDLINHQKFGGWKRREMKEVITYLSKHKQTDDYILLYHTASAFNYYNHTFNLNWPNHTILDEKLDQESILQIIKQYHTNRFWVIIPGTMRTNIKSIPDSSLNDKEAFLHFFNNNFKRVQDFHTTGIYAVLYEVDKSKYTYQSPIGQP
jgi:hypothetical protein